MTNIVASEEPIQQESVQYNKPTSEAAISAIGALANAIREIMTPVGTVLVSYLDEVTFQSENNSPTTRWILADGRNVAGSVYQTLTGSATVVDLRGVFIRGKNGSRSGSTGNPDGNLAIGAYTADKFNSHAHNVTDPGHLHGVTDPGHTHTSNVTDSGHTHTFPINNFLSLPIVNNNVAGTDQSAAAATSPFTHMTSATTGISVANASAATGVSISSNTIGISLVTTSGNESAPRNVTLNFFIRIN